MKKLKLTNSDLVTIIDDDVYDALSEYGWNLMSKGKARCSRWWAPRFCPELHQAVWFLKTGEWPPEGMDIDHVNGNPLDNRWTNLQLLTKEEHRRKTGLTKKTRAKSGYRGVSLQECSGKWKAQISLNGQTKNLGNYDTAEEATHAYDAIASIKHGGQANLNFPEVGDWFVCHPSPGCLVL